MKTKTFVHIAHDMLNWLVCYALNNQNTITEKWHGCHFKNQPNVFFMFALLVEYIFLTIVPRLTPFTGDMKFPIQIPPLLKYFFNIRVNLMFFLFFFSYVDANGELNYLLVHFKSI